MANQDQLDILKQGAERWKILRSDWRTWGDWTLRRQIELRGADLSGANLSEIEIGGVFMPDDEDQDNDFGKLLPITELSCANLSIANLVRINLSYANLRGADLSRANLQGANLTKAILSKADLTGAFLSDANLTGAYLHEAALMEAIFRKAILNKTDLSQAYMQSTIFGDVDLSLVVGLDTVEHYGPSTIGIDTIYRSQGNIPEAFLRGAGVPDSFIEYTRSLVGKPIDYYSCFISYSSNDQAFARRWYADLQGTHVRCWFAPEDLKIGAKMRTSIDESIRLHDKLLLILSDYSVASQWIEQEVERALARERKEDKVILFPIRLDQTVMDIEEGWPALIRNTRNIGDFTRWKRHDAYQKAFARLLRDLKAEG